MSCIVLTLVLISPAVAHEVRPAYLEIKERENDLYEALWKVPAMGNLRLAIYIELPDSTRTITEPRAFISGGAFIERWSFHVGGGIIGDTIGIRGLNRTMTDVLIRIERLNGTTQVQLVEPQRPWFVVAATPSIRNVAWTYLVLGVEHILFGIDHLLFVLTLLLVVNGIAKLVQTITAFTIAHSITLALAALGMVSVPGPPVEAIIALSIAFVAIEVLKGQQGTVGLTAKAPWIIAFSFGLLHGFGFASALSEIGLPEQAIPLSLFFFNVGVEAGQLIFVAVFMLFAQLFSKSRIQWPAWSRKVLPYGIGSLAMFWVIERVAGFF